MQKTRLGISVGLLAAATFFSGLFGGYVATILLAGYTLLFEDNAWLKKAVVKAVAVMISFSVLGFVVGLIPDLIGLINSIFNIFGGHFTLTFVDRLFSSIAGALSLIKDIVFVLLGVKALSQGSIALPVIDKIIGKYMD